MEPVTMLNKMAKYDFSAPINVTMIFEDSDDDTIVMNDESSCPATVTTNETSLNLNIDQYSNQTVKENGKTIKKKCYLNEVNNNNLKSNSPLSRASKKRKLKDPEVVYTVDAIVDQYENLNHAYQQKYSEMHGKGNENCIQTNKTKKATYTCKKIRKDQSEQISNKINSSLVKLSEHLILIMDAYYQMETKLRSINDASIRRKSQDAFVYIRQYFLDLSFDMLDALILPQENNTKFINSFLDNTVNIAVSKKGIKCNRQHVYTFYKYMLQWTKLQKKRSNRLHEQNDNNPDTNTVLKQLLNKSPMQYNIPAGGNVPEITHCTDTSCIFSSGPPGREITISVNPHALNGGYANNACQPQTCSLMQTANESSKSLNPIYQTPVINTNNNYQSLGYNQTPTEAPSENHYQARSLNNLSQMVYYTPASIPTTQYSVRQANYYHNRNYYPQTMATQLPTQTQVDRTRSTESSESGYASPSYGSPNVNPMDRIRSEEQPVFRPVISDIVSLTPRCQYTSMPGCHMCGKPTEFLCSMCYTYYCSTFCQQLDSQFHQAVCRRT